MSLFEVMGADISALNDADLRELVARLAARELTIHGLPCSAVTAGGHQDAADGGIDVRVSLAEGTIAGFVPRPITGFQVKATRMAPAAIRDEMSPKGALRPAIRALAEAGGAYVIVAPREDPTDSALQDRRAAMRRAAGDDRLHVDFYGQDRLARWVNEHPGLVAWVQERLGRPCGGWKPYGDWSNSRRPLQEPYLVDAGLRLFTTAGGRAAELGAEAGLTEIRRLFAGQKAAVRLVGLSGVGKTRFAQALFDDRIGKAALDPNSVVYGDLGGSLDPLPEHLVERLAASGSQAVLIVDNCPSVLHGHLAKAISTRTAPLSLLTIEHEVTDDEREGTEVFRLEPASEELIERLLASRHPDLSGPDRRRVAAFSGGNFRIALALAHTAGKGDSLASLSDSELMDRLLFQRQSKDEALRKAARALSLVHSVDVERLRGDGTELTPLASLAGQEPEALFGHIATLQSRGLVQQRGRYRALLPHAIAQRLAKEALAHIHLDQLQGDLIDRAPERLLKSFSRRLGELHDCQEVQRIVHAWLAEGGRLAKVEQLDDLGMTLLDNVAPVDPEAALEAIRRAVGRVGAGGFEEEKADRLVRLLRSLAYEPAQFDDATDLIAAFARPYAEKAEAHSPAKEFSELFHIVLSGTHAPPDQRARLVRRLARSGDRADQALALRALAAMLHVGYFSSSHRFTFGARRRDFGYAPKTADEMRAWFAEALALAADLDAEPGLSARVRRLVAGKLPGLLRSIGVTPELEALAHAWADKGGWPEAWTALRRALRLVPEAPGEDRARLSALIPRLAPRGLADRIRVYVPSGTGSTLDPLDPADPDDAEGFTKARQEIEAECVRIGEDLARDPAALAQHLPSLLETRSTRVFDVGRGLGGMPADSVSIWQAIIAAFRQLPSETRQSYLLGGMMAGIAARDRALADRLLDDALRGPDLQPCFVWLQCVAGLDEAGVRRIVQAARLPAIPTASFADLGVGRACDGLRPEQMAAILDAIAERDDGPEIAIDVFAMRLWGLAQRSAALESVEKQAGLRLLRRVSFSRSRDNDGYNLAEVARACLDAGADEAAARDLLTRLAEAERAGHTSVRSYRHLLKFFAERFPLVLLDVLVDPDRAESVELLPLFDEDDTSILGTIPEQVLLDWAAVRPDRRAPALARVIPLWNASPATAGDGPGSLTWTEGALDLLALAEDPVSVLDALFDRLSPSSWSGSLSELLASRLPLLHALEREADPRVALWAQDAARRLEDEITRERQRESEQHRKRDERFAW